MISNNFNCQQLEGNSIDFLIPPFKIKGKEILKDGKTFEMPDSESVQHLLSVAAKSGKKVSEADVKAMAAKELEKKIQSTKRALAKI